MFPLKNARNEERKSQYKGPKTLYSCEFPGCQLEFEYPHGGEMTIKGLYVSGAHYYFCEKHIKWLSELFGE